MLPKSSNKKEPEKKTKHTKPRKDEGERRADNTRSRVTLPEDETSSSTGPCSMARSNSRQLQPHGNPNATATHSRKNVSTTKHVKHTMPARWTLVERFIASCSRGSVGLPSRITKDIIR